MGLSVPLERSLRKLEGMRLPNSAIIHAETARHTALLSKAVEKLIYDINMAHYLVDQLCDASKKNIIRSNSLLAELPQHHDSSRQTAA